MSSGRASPGSLRSTGSGVTTLTDVGVDFCQAGALPGDFVTLFGCTVDQQCGPLQVCRRSDTAPETAGTLPIDGLCAPMDPTQQAQQLVDCAPLLNSVRRYEILDATDVTGRAEPLTLQPKIDEIASASLGGCTLHNPCGPASDPTRATFTCEAVSSAQDLRCVETCTTDADCRPGRTCVSFPNAVIPDPTMPSVPARFCADGPMLTPDLIGKCGLGQLTAYKLGAGASFLVQGNAPTPYVPGNVNATTFSCEPNPARLDRIPYFQTANGVRTPLASCGLDPIPPLDPANLQPSTDAQQAALLTLAAYDPDPQPVPGRDGGGRGQPHRSAEGPPPRAVSEPRGPLRAGERGCLPRRRGADHLRRARRLPGRHGDHARPTSTSTRPTGSWSARSTRRPRPPTR